MLAGLAGSSLVVGWQGTVTAFAVAAMVFTAALAGTTIAVVRAGAGSLRSLRLSGPAVRRWSGYLLVVLAAWFGILALLPNPPLT